jgi:microcin C transport system substrate-binding protein
VVDLSPFTISRRRFLQASAFAGVAATCPTLAFANIPKNTALHGLSVFGDLALPADFTHFPSVNPDAPKGGRMVFQPPSWAFNQNPMTFNTMNGFVLRGDAPPRIELIFDSLMVRHLDEPDAVYGLVAESVTLLDDGRSFVFSLRPQARFHDGSRLTAEDVAFSYSILKEKGHPNLSSFLRDIETVEATGEYEVRMVFAEGYARTLPTLVTGLPIFSKAYYEARDFGASTLEAPLGSGAYKVGNYSAGSFIEFERVEDYWAKDLPVTRGTGNFDTIRIEFFP